MIKNLPANAGDVRGSGSIPGLGRYPVEENGNSLQDAGLENPIDRGAWWAKSMGSETPILWPPDANSQPIGKDADAEKD